MSLRTPDRTIELYAGPMDGTTVATGATRIHGVGQREAIGVAVDVVGQRIMARLPHLQFVAGVDPLFAGIHGFMRTDDGRSHRETACCCYPHHLLGPADRRVTTILLPSIEHPRTVVHEIGHALHATYDFEPNPTPVTAYARTNRWEAFAEAFTSWVWPSSDYGRVDDETLALFNSI